MCEKIKGYAKKKSFFAEYTDMPKRNTAHSGMGYPIADRTAAASARRVRTVRWSPQNSQTVFARGWFFVGIGSRFFGAFVVYYWKYKHRRNAMTGICQSGYKKITQHSRCFHFDFHPAAQSVFRISVFSVPSVFWQAVFCCPFVDLFTILWYNGEYRIFMHVSRDFLYS